jgi:hypothetical protein
LILSPSKIFAPLSDTAAQINPPGLWTEIVAEKFIKTVANNNLRISQDFNQRTRNFSPEIAIVGILYRN